MPRGALPIVAGYFLAWTLVALFFFTREVSRRVYWNEPLVWKSVLTVWLVGEYIWGLVAVIVLWFGSRWPLERRVLGRRIALHLLLSAVVAGAQLALETAAYLQLGTLSAAVSASFWRAWGALLVVGFHGNIISYWVILGVQTGYRHYRKLEEREGQALRLELHAAELRTQLVRAQMSALKMQLHPHFLFNTLHSVSALMHKDVRAADRMLALLGDLLRDSFDKIGAQEVSLKQELGFLERYLEIERIRFRDRLHVEIDVAPEALDAAVPNLILQPLVENAIRHGAGRRREASHVRIVAFLGDGWLRVLIRDDGPGLPTEEELSRRGGVGLANTQARLAQIYGSGHRFGLRNRPEGGVEVELSLPFRLHPAEASTPRTSAPSAARVAGAASAS